MTGPREAPMSATDATPTWHLEHFRHDQPRLVCRNTELISVGPDQYRCNVCGLKVTNNA